MKKLLIIAALTVAAATSQACDGTCACGGVKPPTELEKIASSLRTVGEWGAYLGAGFYLSAHGAMVWPIGIPAMCVYLSREQRAYNLAHGITHSRAKRKANR